MTKRELKKNQKMGQFLRPRLALPLTKVPCLPFSNRRKRKVPNRTLLRVLRVPLLLRLLGGGVVCGALPRRRSRRRKVRRIGVTSFCLHLEASP